MNAIIQIENVALDLGGRAILSDISFSIFQGEYLSIIGPNGAGKTTLMRCLLGQYAYRGSIRIDGEECTQLNHKKLAHQISYVPQTHDVEFPLTVYDFVMMGRYPYLSPLSPAQKKDIAAVETALDLTATQPFRKRLLRNLSGGERQKVYIAAALAQETPIILLDEPATFLDWKHQSDVMHLLKKINRECGTTLVTVNHDLNSAARWSDRIIAIKDGGLLFDGPPAELIQPDPLKKLFDTPFVRKEALTPAPQPD